MLIFLQSLFICTSCTTCSTCLYCRIIVHLVLGLLHRSTGRTAWFVDSVADQLIGLFIGRFYSMLTSPPTSRPDYSSPVLHRQLRRLLLGPRILHARGLSGHTSPYGHRQLRRGLLGAQTSPATPGLLGARTSPATPQTPRCSDIASYAGTPCCSNIASYTADPLLLEHRQLCWDSSVLGHR